MIQEITREIEIDAGHRIPNHKSKCKNIHGHRYKIQATVQGEICTENGNPSEGMVVDFSVIKETMHDFIHNFCDHVLILWKKDELFSLIKVKSLVDISEEDWEDDTSVMCEHEILGKILMVNFIPTAENLARYWFNIMIDPIKVLSRHKIHLIKVRVFETPNCWADYNG